MLLHILSRIRYIALSDLLRRSPGNHRAALVTAFRPDINQIIRRLNHIQVMFNDNDRIAAVRQSAQNLDQLMDIGKMQSRRRLIQNVDRLSRSSPSPA